MPGWILDYQSGVVQIIISLKSNMERYDDFDSYGNCYVNIPLFILKTYWQNKDACFNTFILHVLAFGTATQQIMRLDYDEVGNSRYEALTESAEANLDLFLQFISEANEYRQTSNLPKFDFDEKISDYEEWFHNNGLSEWTRRVKWVGITVTNLCKMILEHKRFVSGIDGRRSYPRMTQKWMIYLGLKSTIGQKAYFECSWDCILNRSMGFISRLDYDSANLGDNDWTIPFRIKRKTKDKMIERLKNEFGLNHNPIGYKSKKYRWSFKKP